MKSSVKLPEPLNAPPLQLYTNCDRLNTANATRKRKTRQGSLCSTLQGAKTRFAPDHTSLSVLPSAPAGKAVTKEKQQKLRTQELNWEFSERRSPFRHTRLSEHLTRHSPPLLLRVSDCAWYHGPPPSEGWPVLHLPRDVCVAAHSAPIPEIQSPILSSPLDAAARCGCLVTRDGRTSDAGALPSLMTRAMESVGESWWPGLGLADVCRHPGRPSGARPKFGFAGDSHGLSTSATM